MKIKSIKMPMYQIGQLVSFNRGSGEIAEICKMLSELDMYGKFDPQGLSVAEYSISDMSLPNEFDGHLLKIHYPERDYGNFIGKARTKLYAFSGYSYLIGNIWLPERKLALSVYKPLKQIAVC